MVSPSFCAEVYSANNNVWRNVEPNPIDFLNSDNFDVCVNGFLFAAGRYGVIAFDLKTEVFNCAIKFPAPTFDDNITEYNGLDLDVRITEFKDFIAVIIYTRNSCDCKVDLWALDDDACLLGRGIQASWTLIHNIYIGQPVQFFHGYFKGIRRAFSKLLDPSKSTGTLRKMITRKGSFGWTCMDQYLMLVEGPCTSSL
ncbi:hypothetical protein POM88_040851 [Heracleum sosnowskyi]|uniref:F-box protein n=1 Tax=Heracleum sosnowskyi TaxID=360622 RepID=A0AAD8HFL6_9APIA|nr:hypothetical protein POM88_040851 [Heracleum sosnowskyi]